MTSNLHRFFDRIEVIGADPREHWHRVQIQRSHPLHCVLDTHCDLTTTTDTVHCLIVAKDQGNGTSGDEADGRSSSSGDAATQLECIKEVIKFVYCASFRGNEGMTV